MTNFFYITPFSPKIQKARLTDTRTSVELNWTVPPDTRRTTWEYGVFYGASMDEIYGRGNERRAPVGNTSLTVDGLDSCESYIFAVAVMGPRGVGRLSDPVTEVTKYSPVAPPKDLRLEVDERNMKIKWNASCPQVRVKKIWFFLMHFLVILLFLFSIRRLTSPSGTT